LEWSCCLDGGALVVSGNTDDSSILTTVVAVVGAVVAVVVETVVVAGSDSFGAAAPALSPADDKAGSVSVSTCAISCSSALSSSSAPVWRVRVVVVGPRDDTSHCFWHRAVCATWCATAAAVSFPSHAVPFRASHAKLPVKPRAILPHDFWVVIVLLVVVGGGGGGGRS